MENSSTTPKPKRIHGGKRAGAGRKKNPPGASISVSVPPPGLSATDLAKFYAAAAVEAAAAIAFDGSQPASARVSALKELLERSEGKSKPGSAVQGQGDMFPDNGWDALLTPGAGERVKAN